MTVFWMTELSSGFLVHGRPWEEVGADGSGPTFKFFHSVMVELVGFGHLGSIGRRKRSWWCTPRLLVDYHLREEPSGSLWTWGIVHLTEIAVESGRRFLMSTFEEKE